MFDDADSIRRTPAAEAEAASGSAAADAGLRDAAERALSRAIDRLLAKQHEDGHWCAELEGDSILQSEYLLMMWIIGEQDDPRLPKIANYLRRQQRDTGAWAQYPGGQVGGGKVDLSATVKGYFALKLMGDDPDAEHMRKARAVILAHGGAERINSFSKYYLAALGQVSYKAVPIIPPQLIFLPRWCYFHLRKVSAWSRTMIVPLSIVTAHRPATQVPRGKGIEELFVDAKNRDRLLATGFGRSRFWTTFFLKLDALLKLLVAAGPLKFGRERALERMERWLIDRCAESDGPGAIFPPIVYLLIALRACRGYPADHPIIRENHEHLNHYMIHGVNGKPRNTPADVKRDDPAPDTIRLQPCESPVWDTGIASYALTRAGLDREHESLRKASAWMVSKQVNRPADWADNFAPPDDYACWAFEYNNPWYPDADDTAMVSMALRRIGDTDGVATSVKAIPWLRAIQNGDGGWAAFDKGSQGRDLFECVPFADHNAMQDPSCPDITGRVLEGLGQHGLGPNDPMIRAALGHLKRTQEHDGCWVGRWGVNYVYGTFQVLSGLESIGYDMDEPWVQKAGQWLLDHQHADGSFGESADSYEDPSLRGQGPATASQTAWGAIGLICAFGTDHPAAARAVRWLVNTQLETGDEAGNWHEPQFTGTGFPKVFYLRYHYYRLYFPIMAIGRWLRG